MRRNNRLADNQKTEVEKNLNEALHEMIINLANQYHVNLNNYSPKYLMQGFKVEWEHADTVKSNPETVFKIVLDHIKEIPDYYARLRILEHDANIYWKQKIKPNVFRNI